MTDKTILQQIGRNIRKTRVHSSMTQECLAEMVGCHWTSIARIEAGKHPFQITRFVRITKCLKISANRLLEGVPDEDSVRLRQIAKALTRKRKVAGTKATK